MLNQLIFLDLYISIILHCLCTVKAINTVFLCSKFKKKKSLPVLYNQSTVQEVFTNSIYSICFGSQGKKGPLWLVLSWAEIPLLSKEDPSELSFPFVQYPAMFKMSCRAILNPCVTKLIGGPLPIYNVHKALEEIHLHYFTPLRFWSYLSLQHYLGLTDITSSLKFKLLLLLLLTLLLLQLLPIINNIFITLYMSIAPPTSRDLL